MKLRTKLFLLFAFAYHPSSFGETMSVQDAARSMIQIRDTCKGYVSNGERFWRGDYKKPEDAPGLVLLNKEIQHAVSKARNADSAKEIAWQKCLDTVFNNQNSANYVR